MKTIVAIDFDGVIHKAGTGYGNGDVYDEPMPGAIYTINKLIGQGWEPYVLTARPPEQWPKVHAWLKKHNFPELEVTNVKRGARFYIDNRAIRFTNWPDMAYYLL